MKHIISLIALMCLITNIQAQTFNTKTAPATPSGPTRGTYGTIQSYSLLPGTICAIRSNTVTPISSGVLDTLSNTDTGFVQWTLPNNVHCIYDFAVTKISGTVAGTALLQGSFDNATWYTITGATTYMAASQGASATVTNTAGTKHYIWDVPSNAESFPFKQIQYITSGTMTATYTASVNYKY